MTSYPLSVDKLLALNVAFIAASGEDYRGFIGHAKFRAFLIVSKGSNVFATRQEAEEHARARTDESPAVMAVRLPHCFMYDTEPSGNGGFYVLRTKAPRLLLPDEIVRLGLWADFVAIGDADVRDPLCYVEPPPRNGSRS